MQRDRDEFPVEHRDEQDPTPPGLTDIDVEVRKELAAYIEPAPYPADRAQLVETARDNDAPDHWITVLEHLPPDYRFDSVEEVAQGLGYGYESRPR